MADASRVAALHINAIDTGFISSLGLRFVTALYETLVADKRAFGLVAEGNGEVVGFIAFASDLPALYRSVIRRGGIRFFLILGRQLFSWTRCRRVVETLCYAQRSALPALPAPELLALAVQSDCRSQGIGLQLVSQGLDACHQQGLTQVKVCVGQVRKKAKSLYEKVGFQRVGEIDQHGQTSDMYVWTQKGAK